MLYAGISAYWAAAGTAVLTMAGNAVEPHARTGAALVAAVWLTVAVKLALVADHITASPLAGPFAMSSESVGAVVLSHSSRERCR